MRLAAFIADAGEVPVRGDQHCSEKCGWQLSPLLAGRVILSVRLKRELLNTVLMRLTSVCTFG